MAESRLGIEVQGRNRAGTTVRQVERQLRGLGREGASSGRATSLAWRGASRALAGAGAVARLTGRAVRSAFRFLTLGLTALTGGVFGIGAAFVQQERVERQLAATLRLHNKEVESSIALLKGQAGELQKLTGIGDEAILGIQDQLINLGLWGDELERATRAVLDFAGGTDRELQPAVDAVAQALQGEARELRKYGIQLDRTQVQLGGVGVVLDAIEAKFKGQAEALRGGVGGAWRAFLGLVGDTAENLFAQFAPKVEEMLNGASAAIEGFLERGGFEQMREQFLSVVDTIKGAGNFIGDAFDVLRRDPAFLGTLAVDLGVVALDGLSAGWTAFTTLVAATADLIIAPLSFALEKRLFAVLGKIGAAAQVIPGLKGAGRSLVEKSLAEINRAASLERSFQQRGETIASSGRQRAEETLRAGFGDVQRKLGAVVDDLARIPRHVQERDRDLDAQDVGDRRRQRAGDFVDRKQDQLQQTLENLNRNLEQARARGDDANAERIARAIARARKEQQVLIRIEMKGGLATKADVQRELQESVRQGVKAALDSRDAEDARTVSLALQGA